MLPFDHRTKIVATIGPASNSPEVIKQLVQAGMVVARLNFSHGSYEDHACTIAHIREVSEELGIPVSLLQDLQGPKIRVGQLPNIFINLHMGANLSLVPIGDFHEQLDTIPIDYPFLAEEAEIGARVLLDDGLLELQVKDIVERSVVCQVVRGGVLKSRKGVNFPSINLRLPSLTDKDKQDLEFGLAHGVDWISLSFVRKPEDIRSLKELLRTKGSDVPVIAKVEKPQAIAHLSAILDECDGVMVARGDLGVEMNPEQVPILQKQIIRACNLRSLPVITATQMLESMITNPRPTRAEASDVANAILDGTDAVMLSGESAVGSFPVQAVEMMAKIAKEVERTLKFPSHPPNKIDETSVISEALSAIDRLLDLRCIAAYTTTGYTARLVAAERPRAPVVAFSCDSAVYRRLNLMWGVMPILLDKCPTVMEELVQEIEAYLKQNNLAKLGDTILILGGSPMQKAHGTNFLKIHKISS